jgi:hypothetical protein
MFRATSNRRKHRRSPNQPGQAGRREAFHRWLRYEPLEDRRLLSAGSNDALAGLFDKIVTVSATDPTAGEPSNNGSFRITRTGTTDASLKIYFTLWSSTATRSTTGSGGDYCLKKGTTILTDNSVTIDAGYDYVDVTVAVVDDSVHESTESVKLTLQEGDYYDLGATNTYATVSITDEDTGSVTKPVFGIQANAESVSEPSGSTTFTVTRTGSTADSVDVYLSLTGDTTATLGLDYTLSVDPDAAFTFAAGQTSRTITLTVLDDGAWESTEHVGLSIDANAAYDINTAHNPAGVDIVDDDATVVSLYVNNHEGPYDASESSAPITFKFSRVGDTTSAITVNFKVDGLSTATPNVDYTLSTGGATSIVIPAGQSSASLTMTLVDDSTSEATEIFQLDLLAGAPGSYEIGRPEYERVNIVDNDPVLVTVTALDSTAGEPANGGAFRVTRTGDTSNPLSVAFTMGGDATRGADYSLSIGGTALTGNTITIAAGQSYTDVTLTVIDDTTIEPTETAVVAIQDTDNYELGVSSSVAVSITDDDSSSVTVTATDSTAGEPSSNGNFRITRNGSTDTVAVIAFTMQGTAERGVDYTLAIGTTTVTGDTVVMNIGASSVDVTVQVINDTDAELAETVTMALLEGTSVGNTATIVIADDDSPRQSVTAQDVRGVAGQSISIPVQYIVSTNDNTLSGLGLRMFYDSSFMTFNGFSSLLQTALVSRQDPVADNWDDGDAIPSEGFDDNTTTDRYVLVAWSDMGGNWPNQPLPTTLYVANFTLGAVADGAHSVVNFMASSRAANYSFDPVTINVDAGSSTLDVDGDGRCDALTDGILIMRYLFDPNGAWTTEGALGAEATRTTHDQIKSYLDSAATMLDVDGSGEGDALTDGMLIMRFLFDPEGNWTTDGLTGTGATRTDSGDIHSFLDQFYFEPVTPPAPVPPAAAKDASTSAVQALSALSDVSLAPASSQTVQTQIVAPSSANLSVTAGAHATFDVNYSTDPKDATLSGLGLRMYYNSSRLTYNGLTNVLATGLVSQQTPMDDTDNADGDSNTDKYVLVAWADMGQNWPASLPQRLFTADFTVKAGATTATHVNFDAASTASGWTFASTPVTITPKTVVVASGPTISGVAIPTAKKSITWNAADSEGVASCSLKIDGKNVKKVYGPYAASSGVNYSGVFGSLSAGRHTYVIAATDKKGHASSLTGSFNVVAATNVGPAISGVVVSTAKRLITWNAADADGVASCSLKIDGKNAKKLYGPFAASSGVNFAGSYGSLSAGVHTYTITATDKKGHTTTTTGTFKVVVGSKSALSSTSADVGAVFASLASGPATSAKAEWLCSDLG